MKNRSKTKYSVGMPGVATLVIIFAVLSASVIAILTLSKANSDLNLARVSLENIESYYAADRICEEKIAELRRDGSQGTFTVTESVSDTRELRIEVNITKDSYEILSRKVVYTAEWDADETLDLWPGN